MKLSRKSTFLVASTFAIVAAGSMQNALSRNLGVDGAQAAPLLADYDMQQNANKAGAYIADSAITAKVKAAIVAEPELSALEIKVDTANGVVTLSGTVDTQQKMERASAVATTVDGVKTVNNQLSVKTPG